MKSFLVFLALVGVAVSQQADMRYFLWENDKGEVLIEDLTGTPDLRAAATDLEFHFFSQRNPNQAVIATIDDVSALGNAGFSVNKDTIFIIHGWQNTHESDVNSHIREYTLRDHDVNVFVVDWSPIAGKNYISAKGSVRAVGGFVGEFIKVLQARYFLLLTRVKIVGHSLGGHVAGNAGAALNGQVDRIVGLDPAGPLFSANNIDERLDPTDGVFVQVIHTNGGLLGYRDRLGDSDYYPNGGSSQPGCGIDLTGSCSHSRAYAFYAESLTNTAFVARKCESYKLFTDGSCNNQPSSIMGQFVCDTRASGDYYLNTNSASPYALG